jgi:hypothetical protein
LVHRFEGMQHMGLGALVNLSEVLHQFPATDLMPQSTLPWSNNL